MVWCGIVWDGIVLEKVFRGCWARERDEVRVWCDAVWYRMLWYGIVWYYMTWYGMI